MAKTTNLKYKDGKKKLKKQHYNRKGISIKIRNNYWQLTKYQDSLYFRKTNSKSQIQTHEKLFSGGPQVMDVISRNAKDYIHSTEFINSFFFFFFSIGKFLSLLGLEPITTHKPPNPCTTWARSIQQHIFSHYPPN